MSRSARTPASPSATSWCSGSSGRNGPSSNRMTPFSMSAHDALLRSIGAPVTRASEAASCWVAASRCPAEEAMGGPLSVETGALWRSPEAGGDSEWTVGLARRSWPSSSRPRAARPSPHASTRRSPPRSPASPCGSWRPRGSSSYYPEANRDEALRIDPAPRPVRGAAAHAIASRRPQRPKVLAYLTTANFDNAYVQPQAGRAAAADGARPPLHDRVLQPPGDRHQPRGRRLVPRGDALRAVRRRWRSSGTT